MGGAWIGGLAVASSCLFACAHQPNTELKKTSRNLAQTIRRGDEQAFVRHLSPSIRSVVDKDQIFAAKERAKWAQALSQPQHVQAEALVFLSHDGPVLAKQTAEGWVFAEDPTAFYDQSTPRAALRSLIRASFHERWDILLKLAPHRYRMGLSEDDIRRAWSEGAYAKALREARVRLQDHIAEPIRSDHDQAVLDLGSGRFARLEREGSIWVVVDF